MKSKISFTLILIMLVRLTTSVHAQLPSGMDTTSVWQLSWHDEFDYPNAQLDSQWIAQNGASGGVVLCSRWRDNAVVKDGILELQAKKESRAGQDWTAASIWTKNKFRYGYFECRYKYAAATGTNNSFWMWNGYNDPNGHKAVELDVNEGHYPNLVNTNIHNWTDKDANGGHPTWSQKFALGGIEPQPAYTHELKTTITARKFRFSSKNGAHFHIGEFRIYAPNAAGYPKDAVSNNADTEVPGLKNYTRDASTQITSSGYYPVNGRNTEAKNVANGLNTGNNPSWIAPASGEKWLEITLDQAKEIGCIQFTNGWYGGGKWNALISDYEIEYHDGEKWVELARFDISDGNDFAEEWHTYGMLWTENEIKYFMDGELLRTFPHDFIYGETKIYLSLAILDKGIAGAVSDAIDGTSMKVDYVRYYKLRENTAINKVTENEVSLYPNPAHDLLIFEQTNHIQSIKVFNAQGQKVMEKNMPDQNSLDVSKLPNGVYIFQSEDVDGTRNGKFIKN